MLLVSKIRLRRILAIGLISITLVFGFSLGNGNSDRALAEVLKRDTVGISEDKVLNDTEYESAKISRNQEQAQRSKQAEEKAEKKAEQESIAEKLNLDEIEETLDLD